MAAVVRATVPSCLLHGVWRCGDYGMCGTTWLCLFCTAVIRLPVCPSAHTVSHAPPLPFDDRALRDLLNQQAASKLDGLMAAALTHPHATTKQD